MEIRIPLISYGKRKLIEGNINTLYLEKDYLRWKGRSRYEVPVEDSEFETEEKVYNFDCVMIKDKVSYFERAFINSDNCWQVIVYADKEDLVFRFPEYKEANEFFEKLLSWYFEGITE